MATSTDRKFQPVPIWLLSERLRQDRYASTPFSWGDNDAYFQSVNTVTPADILSDDSAINHFGTQNTLRPGVIFGQDSTPVQEYGPRQLPSYVTDANNELTYADSELQTLSPEFLEGIETSKIVHNQEFWHFDTACSPITAADEIPTDQPYARLIYEALMQAPGHRMMLREIYDWFMHNTNKPQNSGSNGWQNSIRHNLSMNQAFENEKSDHGRGNAKRANSVWYLTAEAITHGVQSTTRYRKQTQAKAGAHSRKTRQKHGSRFARVARSRSGAHAPEQCRDPLSNHNSSSNTIETVNSPADSGYPATHGPNTPANISRTTYLLPHFTDIEQLMKHEDILLDDTPRLEPFFFGNTYDELSHLDDDPVSQSAFFM